MGFKEYLKSQEGEKVDNVTRGLIALGSFAFFVNVISIDDRNNFKRTKEKTQKILLIF